MWRQRNPIRRSFSAVLAATLLRYHQRKVRNGRLTSMPFFLWKSLPEPCRKWLRYRVLKPAEDYAWKQVRSHEVLGRLAGGSSNSWAISPSTILFLWRLLDQRGPLRILEFGGGVSTSIFATYAEKMAERGHVVRVLSVDHEQRWLKETHRKLRDAGQDGYVTLLHAPLSRQRLCDKEVLTYTVAETALSEVAEKEGFDLCLIDGPPQNVGRGGCLPLAAPYLADHAVILLDDAYRHGEQEVLQEWSKAWNQRLGKLRLLLADRHGVAIMHWGKRERPGTSGRGAGLPRDSRKGTCLDR